MENLTKNTREPYSMRTLQAYGMDNTALQTIYCSAVTAKLCYASSAWWGFTSATNQQRLDAFIWRSCFVPPNLPSFADLFRAADENLFDQVITNKKHVLHGLLPLPSVASQNYNLQNHKQNLELPTKTSQLINS